MRIKPAGINCSSKLCNTFAESNVLLFEKKYISVIATGL